MASASRYLWTENPSFKLYTELTCAQSCSQKMLSCKQQHSSVCAYSHFKSWDVAGHVIIHYRAHWGVSPTKCNPAVSLFSPSEAASALMAKTAARKPCLCFLLTATFCEISTASCDSLYTGTGPWGDWVDRAGAAVEEYQRVASTRGIVGKCKRS